MIVLAVAAGAKQLSPCTLPVAEFFVSETLEIFWLPHFSGDYLEVVTICMQCLIKTGIKFPTGFIVVYPAFIHLG